MSLRVPLRSWVADAGAGVRAFEDVLITRRLSVYGVAVSRILGALAYVGILLTNFSQRDLLFGPASEWARSYREEYPQAVWLGLLENAPGLVFTVCYLLVILVGLAFAAGWHSRLTGPLLLIGAFQILEMNPLVSDQGDNILRIGIFFILLTDNSAVWSLDAARRRRTGVDGGWLPAGMTRLFASPGARTAQTLLHNGAVIALAAQLVIIYISAGLFKAGGDGWQFGSAIAYPLRLDEYRVWPVLNDLVVSSSVAVWLMTYLAVFLQLYFPALLLNRIARRIALVAVILLHLGIAVLMGLPWFSLAMVAFDSIFVSRATYEALGRWTERRWRATISDALRRRATGTS